MTFSLDFNHGATKPANDPRAPDVCERINAHIDAAFFAKRDAQARREYVGASAIGNDCLRSVQFSYVGVNPDEGRITGQKLRIFEAGHVWEAALIEWFRMAGFVLDVINPETQKQFGWLALGGKGKGHVDGVLRAGPVPLDYPCLWEAKALNEKGWQEIKKNGLALAKPVYAGQIAINQAYLDMTTPALFTAINKNTEELHHELVPFDQPFAQQMSDNMARVIDATKHQELLPRAYSDPLNFRCRRFCDYYRSCWGRDAV